MSSRRMHRLFVPTVALIAISASVILPAAAAKPVKPARIR